MILKYLSHWIKYSYFS